MNKDQTSVALDEQVIVAQCTPVGAGAIALLRLSGKNVFQLVDKAARLASGQKLVDQKSHTIHFGFVVDQQNQSIESMKLLIKLLIL